MKSTKGEMIQLDNLVTLTEQSSSPQLYRHNRFLSATISTNTNPGISIGKGIDEMNSIANEVLDESFRTELSGPSKDFKESSSTLLFAFLLSLLLVYLILSAQFESFRDPFIVMFTVPLALAGAIFALWITDSTLNIFSQIGIIVLVGIVKLVFNKIKGDENKKTTLTKNIHHNQRLKRCHKCGSVMRITDRFCPRCGARVV